MYARELVYTNMFSSIATEIETYIYPLTDSELYANAMGEFIRHSMGWALLQAGALLSTEIEKTLVLGTQGTTIRIYAHFDKESRDKWDKFVLLHKLSGTDK